MEDYAKILLNPLIFGALFIGACVILLGYIFKSYRSEKVDLKRSKIKVQVRSEKTKEILSVKLKKKTENRWTGRLKHQQFSHPWHLTSFKGHTGDVLDLDFSSNGKYLATCSDDDPGGTSTEDSSGSTTSSSESNKEDTSASPCINPRKGLSRRQKKNRRSLDSSPAEQKPKAKMIAAPKKEQKRPKEEMKNRTPIIYPKIKNSRKFGIDQEIFYSLLYDYLLLPDQLFRLGFPEEYNKKVRVLKHVYGNKTMNIFYGPRHQRKSYSDSDQGSTSSSDSLEDSESGKSSPVPLIYDTGLFRTNYATEKVCVRCEKEFFTTASEYLTLDTCRYHWGKIRYHSEGGYQPLYTCCKNLAGSEGCTVGRLHVWNGLEDGLNDSLNGFVKTQPLYGVTEGYGVYALDCEMCFTIKGLELCKVTLVSMDGNIVYDHFVKPESEVIDYNTRFSGVTERNMQGENVKNLRQVQFDLLNIIFDRTILIGHGLENDLCALKLLHYYIVDTSLCFPHERGFPFKYSLKQLVSTYLNREIQNNVGHDSYEDALSCMELMLWKTRMPGFVISSVNRTKS